MKSSKKCPKCECEYVGLFPSTALTVSDTAGVYPAHGSFAAELYTCADCGYSETYLCEPVRNWSKSPEDRGLEFTWIREPPTTNHLYR